MAKTSKPKSRVEIINRKAKFEFHFHTQMEVGITLTGTEIKSVRLGEVKINEGADFDYLNYIWTLNE